MSSRSRLLFSKHIEEQGFGPVRIAEAELWLFALCLSHRLGLQRDQLVSCCGIPVARSTLAVALDKTSHCVRGVTIPRVAGAPVVVFDQLWEVLDGRPRRLNLSLLDS